MNTLSAPAPVNEPARLPRGRLVVSGLLLLLFLAPFVLAAFNHFEGFSFANESIAYRWGHPSRATLGDIPPILPQGFTILAVQQYLVSVTEYFAPPNAANLRNNLQIFCWGTYCILIGVFTTTLVAALRQPNLSASQVWLIFLPGVISIHATGMAGWYYCLLPDYYLLNAILACAALLLLRPIIQGLLDPAISSVRPLQLVALGAGLGLGVANKITWAVPCLLAFGLVLLNTPRPVRALLNGLLLAATAVLTLGLVMLVYYRFEVSAILPGAKEWLSFMKGQQGSLTLWGPEFMDRLRRFNYGLLYPLQVLTALCALLSVRNWRARLGVLLGLASIGALLWMLAQRPAGTTLWDINVLTLFVTMTCALLVPQPWMRRAIAAVWTIALIVAFWRNPSTQTIHTIKASEPATSNRFEVFTELTRFAKEKPQLIMLVNNEYGHGGVHELLLKAASDFPTWNVSVGRTWLKRFGADITFLHEYGGAIILPEDIPDVCLVWYDRPDLPLLSSRFAQLGEFVRDPRNETLSLPVFVNGLPSSPVQVWLHAVRRRSAQPFVPMHPSPVPVTPLLSSY